MKPFRTVRSTVTPLPEPNIDTDQIVPKQFLKLTTRSGFGKYLFYDRRYDQNGGARPDFVLNDPKHSGSRILAAGDNFGCGSSREHAVWALQDYGFDVVVAASFADIFYSNCIKNGLLPVRLPQAHLSRIAGESGEVVIDLESQLITIQNGSIPFDMDAYQRTILLEGQDDIARTLQYQEAIAVFEREHPCPTIY